MVKPNYAYERRQRELEKKQKREDKALKKQATTQDSPTSPEQAEARTDRPADPPSP